MKGVQKIPEADGVRTGRLFDVTRLRGTRPGERLRWQFRQLPQRDERQVH
ncbi:hypothetical protein Enr13x_05310 [Stieleria neptunia]|uniref:Uncharacterized protein n=1 Tax=Stieleria neptunia TaxID=2527979 RepID=A0A518HIL6_9BACT|nr:hypothetical protein Enr13x_05310 [Stieleria neptunia]